MKRKVYFIGTVGEMMSYKEDHPDVRVILVKSIPPGRASFEEVVYGESWSRVRRGEA